MPTKYKKLLELNIFDENKLKTFRKKYKLGLEKRGKLIELVKYFNEKLMTSKKELLIYGKRAVYEALENNVEIDKVFIQKSSFFHDNIKNLKFTRRK